MRIKKIKIIDIIKVFFYLVIVPFFGCLRTESKTYYIDYNVKLDLFSVINKYGDAVLDENFDIAGYTQNKQLYVVKDCQIFYIVNGDLEEYKGEIIEFDFKGNNYSLPKEIEGLFENSKYDVSIVHLAEANNFYWISPFVDGLALCANSEGVHYFNQDFERVYTVMEFDRNFGEALYNGTSFEKRNFSEYLKIRDSDDFWKFKTDLCKIGHILNQMEYYFYGKGGYINADCIFDLYYPDF